MKNATENTGKHTPTPWRAEPNGTGEYCAWNVIGSGINGFVCQTSGNAKEDARLIVTAVNSYSTLKAENERLENKVLEQRIVIREAAEQITALRADKLELNRKWGNQKITLQSYQDDFKVIRDMVEYLRLNKSMPPYDKSLENKGEYAYVYHRINPALNRLQSDNEAKEKRIQELEKVAEEAKELLAYLNIHGGIDEVEGQMIVFRLHEANNALTPKQ